MIEFLRHALGLCGENHGLLYWIVTGSIVVITTPFLFLKAVIEKLIERRK
jgi:hypothetical protein